MNLMGVRNVPRVYPDEFWQETHSRLYVLSLESPTPTEIESTMKPNHACEGSHYNSGSITKDENEKKKKKHRQKQAANLHVYQREALMQVFDHARSGTSRLIILYI